MPTESTLQHAIALALERRGAHVTNVVVAGRAGCPDLLCAWRGLFLAFEVKLPGERPAPVQRVELTRIRRAGGQAHVVHSVAEALAVLDDLTQGGAIPDTRTLMRAARAEARPA